jgi:hypothetical protein
MKEGLLWYDDNPGRDLAEKIRPAARRYRQKFGAAPEVCYVHPSTLTGSTDGKVKQVGEVRVAPLPSVLRHHFWLGREEKRRRRRAAKPKGG